jgi:hypothetical protein
MILKLILYAFVYSLIVFHIYLLAENFEKLTILTRPTYSMQIGWEHHAVMRSLLRGLNSLNVSYNYNPSTVNAIGDVVLVTSNHDALKQAVALKKQGRIKKLFVGPNFYPYEVDFPEVDVYFVPSEWVIMFAQSNCRHIVPRCKVWYGGVDPDYWSPGCALNDKSRNVLVYWKTESASFCEAIEDVLRKYGWNPIRLRYGYYKHEQLKEILQNCRFAVFISASESQGLALAECWSMNVPTLPWNPKSVVILGSRCNFVSSCPYLTAHTGVYWQNLSELETILQTIDKYLSICSPRKWVLDSMTDEISVDCLIKIINKALVKES